MYSTISNIEEITIIVLSEMGTVMNVMKIITVNIHVNGIRCLQPFREEVCICIHEHNVNLLSDGQTHTHTHTDMLIDRYYKVDRSHKANATRKSKILCIRNKNVNYALFFFIPILLSVLLYIVV